MCHTYKLLSFPLHVISFGTCSQIKAASHSLQLHSLCLEHLWHTRQDSSSLILASTVEPVLALR